MKKTELSLNEDIREHEKQILSNITKKSELLAKDTLIKELKSDIETINMLYKDSSNKVSD